MGGNVACRVPNEGERGAEGAQVCEGCMSKRDFLERMRAGRAALNIAISGLNEEQLTQEIVTGDWTVKDTLAHVAAWQGEALRSAKRAELGEPGGPEVAESIDEWNRRRVEERRRLPLVDVIQEFNDTYDELVRCLEGFPEDGGPAGPRSWDQTGPLWWLTEHDDEHAAVIAVYRQRTARP
jgi:hypothetical protein